MTDTEPKGFLDQILRNSKANENLDYCSNEGNSQLVEREHTATRNVSSPKEHICLTSTDLMVCVEFNSPFDDIFLVSPSKKNSKTKWKRLARSKEKAHSMNMQVIGNKRQLN